MPDVVSHVAATLQRVFTEKADQVARETTFVQRERKWSGSLFCSAMVGSLLSESSPTLRGILQQAGVHGLDATVQSLDQRFGPESAAFMEAMLGVVIHERVVGEPKTLEVMSRFQGVLLQDSSTITLPASLPPEWAERWPGCSGQAVKLHARVDWKTGALDGPILGPARHHDRRSPHESDPTTPGALRLADLGYFTLKGLKKLGDSGGYWLTRVPANTLAAEESNPKEFRPLPQWVTGEETGDRPILLGKSHPLRCRLLWQRVPSEVSQQRRRLIRKEAKRRGRTPSRNQLAMADWTLLATNVPPEMLTVEEGIQLMRLRWQIELVFKLWKSHVEVDEFASHKPWRVCTEFLAKLVAATILHWFLLATDWHSPYRSFTKTAQGIRSLAPIVTCHLNARPGSLRRLREAIHHLRDAVHVGTQLERRRKHPNHEQMLLGFP